jgi:hypothetical protein
MDWACEVSITQKRVTITPEQIQALIHESRPNRSRGVGSAAVAT